MYAIVGQVFHFELSHAHIKISVHIGAVGVVISKLVIDQVELSKRKSASDYIRTLILFGFVYDVDYSYLRQYNETLGKISGNLNQIVKRINSTGNVYEEDIAEVKAIMDEVWRMQKAMRKKQPLIRK